MYLTSVEISKSSLRNKKIYLTKGQKNNDD